MPQLFRAMKEDQQNRPEVGPTARTLGLRPGRDVPATRPDDMVQPRQGGLSASPDDPMNLPIFRRPPQFGGVAKDPVWVIEDADLPGDLNYRPDPRQPGHGFIEPALPMTLDDYQKAIEQTQDLWQKVTSWPITGSSSHGT